MVLCRPRKSLSSGVKAENKAIDFHTTRVLLTSAIYQIKKCPLVTGSVWLQCHVDSNGQRNALICRSRTGVSSMRQRKRIRYSEAQKAEMWDRWQKGDSMHAIAGAFDRYHSSVSNILTQNGGIRPAVRKRASISLTLIERETISRGLASQQTIRLIATQISRAPSTVSREIHRNGGVDSYRASFLKALWMHGVTGEPSTKSQIIRMRR